MNAETQSADSTDEPHNSIHELTGFQRDMLVIVHYTGASSGQTIKATYEDATGMNTSIGQLYPNLDTLANLGLVDKRAREPDRRTNTYELTDRGLDALVYYNHWITGGNV